MRAVLAILFSVLLVVTQSVLPANAVLAQAPSAKSCCACGKSCCVKQSAPASTPLPAAPVSPHSVKLVSGAVATVLATLSAPARPVLPLSSSPVSLFRSEAVPVYAWNCVFLL